MKRVIITKQAGETGLRLPGTSYLVPDREAERLVDLGLVVMADVSKEVKESHETKELKVKRQTKARK